MDKRLWFFVVALVAGAIFTGNASAQFGEHPRMWVKASDRDVILKEISQHEWKRKYYESFTQRVRPDVEAYKKNKAGYLKRFPLPWHAAKDGKIPAMIPVDDLAVSDRKKNDEALHLLLSAVDCGVLYFLTGDDDYAEFAASVLNTIVVSWVQAKPSQVINNGGWLDQENHLREAREYGAQIPIVYDFVYTYLKKGGNVFNPVSGRMEAFAFKEAQQVFKTYCDLAVDHGIIGTNWPVFESMSLLGNALALDDESLSKYYLAFVTEKSGAHQDALPKIGAFFKEHGGLWPESINYADATTTYLTYILTWLSRYDSDIINARDYTHIPYALSARYYMQYPNEKDNILYGDAHRHFGMNNEGYELAYAYGKTVGDDDLTKRFASLLQYTIQHKGYDRSTVEKRTYGAEVYTEPVKLLWFVPELEGDAANMSLPVTNTVPFAGITVQRNMHTKNTAKEGMMFFVGGAGFVHGHASGMNMELFGKGYVLGNKPGRSAYTTNIHENYYRLFAAHNTVVVNGASRGEGGWVNLGINTVKQEAAEPMLNADPVSANHSFVASGFVDDRGDKAEAIQLRTMGIVRTSATTGYYIDFYKSKSSLPNEFHDYIYHNIGESTAVSSNSKIEMKDDSMRFRDAVEQPWKKNNSFRNPGWQFFTDVKTVERFEGKMTVTFTAKALEALPIGMRVHFPAVADRSYTTALSPPSTEAPTSYAKKPTQALVVRQHGEAWKRPFMAVYEPFEGNADNASVKLVEALYNNVAAKGLKVESVVDGKQLRQIIIVQDNDDDLYEDAGLQLLFRGRYLVLTLDETNAVLDIYIGSGKHFGFQDWDIVSNNSQSFACSIAVGRQHATVKSTTQLSIKSPGIKIDNE